MIPAVAGCLQTTANDYSRADGFNAVPVFGFGGESDASSLSGAGDLQPPVTGRHGAPGFVAHPVAMRESGQGYWMEDEKAGTLRAEGENRPSRPSNVVAVPVAFGGDVARTLNARHDSSPCADRGMDVVAVPVAQVQWASGGGKVHNPTAQALRSGAEHNYQFAQVGMQVRRLTPTEAERLQGFPDGWTEGFSDSCRYKMLGNAVCVNVAAWIAGMMANRAICLQTGRRRGK